MKLFKKLTVALLIACSFMLVMPVVVPSVSNNGYVVEAASKPKMKYKINKAKQSGNYYIVKAKVYNKSNKNLDAASIKVDLYDKNGDKITYGYESIMWMDAKGTWKVAMKIPVGTSKVKKYKVTVDGYYFSTSAYTKLKTTVKKVTKKTTKSSSYVGGSYDQLTVKGEVKNKTGVKLTSVYVTYAFYNKDGNIVGTRFCGYYKGYKKNKKFTVKETSHFIDSAVGAKTCKMIEAHGYNI